MSEKASVPPAAGHATPVPAPVGAPVAQASAPCILCVDDEPNILAALRRVFKDSGYSMRTADSAAAGLRVLESESVDLVIADMHMPVLDGARFLALVRERWPQTMRFLLTGHADTELIAEAVNTAGIYRYISKPWDDDDVVLQVRLALEHRGFERERARMTQLALARTEELKAINASLEQNVSASKDELAQLNQRLKSNFIVTLKVFSSLIETRRKSMVGHSRRVAELARELASRLALEPALVREVFVAGLLHDVGKLGFSDELLDRPVVDMTPRQLQQYRQHPALAEELLMPLQDLRGAAASIASQMERFDGTGFPRQLQGRAILVGARILAVCADYDNLQIGVLAPRLFTPRDALIAIEGSAGKRYDPWVVEAFFALLRRKSEQTASASQTVAEHPIAQPRTEDDQLILSTDLEVDMVLSRDLISPGGLMMLPAGHSLDRRLIQKMRDFEKTDNTKLVIYVRKPAPA